MKPLTCIEGTAVVLDGDNIDTDQIISGRFLYAPRDQLDYGHHFLYDQRFSEDGNPVATHPLNNPIFRNARVLVVDANFGYGSSRTQAAWAVQDFGIEVIVGVSFGSVFASNCALHGLPTVMVEPNVVEQLKLRVRQNPGQKISIDLADMSLITGNIHHPIRMDAIDRHRLVSGKDDFAMTQSVAEMLPNFRSAYRQQFPWLE